MMDSSMEFSNLNILRGTLKQQCLDGQGLYVWEKKTFYLDIPNKALTVTTSSSSSSSVQHTHDEATDGGLSPMMMHGLQTSISLRGAKYAKEWSFSSSLTGFGFDLVWSSGKIWSFLVDDQETCKKWVDFLNISLSLDDDDNPWKSLVSNAFPPDHMEKPPKPPTATQHESNKNSSSLQHEVRSEHVDKGKQHSIAHVMAASVDMLSTVDKVASSSIIPSSSSSSQRSIISIDPNITAAIQPSTRYSQMSHNNTNDDNESIGSLANSNRTDISFQESSNSPYTKTKTHLNGSTVVISSNNNSPLVRTPHRAASDTPTSASDSSKPPSRAVADVQQAHYSSSSSLVSNPIYKPTREASHGAAAAVQGDKRDQRTTDQKTTDQRTTDQRTTTTPIPSNDPKGGPLAPATEQRLMSNRHSHQETVQQQDQHARGSYDALTEERFHELSVMLRQRDTELELLKKRYSKLQTTYDEVVQELEKRLDIAKDKEMQLIRETKRELENKLLRASNENMSYHEAAVKAMKLQHDRELSCVRDELVEERRRHTDLITRAQSLRERAESSDLESQRELMALKDKLSNIGIDTAHARKAHESDKQAWERERKQLTTELESTIQQLKDENERVVNQSREEVRLKVLEMNEKMKVSINNIKNSDMEIVRQELEGKRLRSIAEVQKQCQKEVEMVRTEERKLASIEIANLRQAFLSREHQTSEDVIQLEKLHSLRVAQLENQLTSMKALYKSTEEKLNQATKQLQTGTVEANKSIHDSKLAMEAQEKRSALLHKELQQANTELQEMKSREVSYREQLGKALTQSRVQHAELLEARRQASSGNAQAFQWKHAIKESELSINAAETTVQIAKEEISMLEHELKRLQAENYELKAELSRADKLIYGVPQFKQSLQHHDSSSSSPIAPLQRPKSASGAPFSFYHAVSPELLTPTASSSARHHTAAAAMSSVGSSRLRLKRSSVSSNRK